jgi:prophage regulatory protein
MATIILRKRDVLKRTGLSDTTIWRLERAGKFPQRMQLTEAGSVGWREDEVERWVHDRIRAGGKTPPGRKAQAVAPLDACDDGYFGR